MQAFDENYSQLHSSIEACGVCWCVVLCIRGWWWRVMVFKVKVKVKRSRLFKVEANVEVKIKV